MLYGQWCKDPPLESFFYIRKDLNKCQFDILRFLAENGPHTPYDLWKGPKMGERKRDKSKELGYSYPHIHENVGELNFQERMIDEKQVVRGGRVKKRLSINLQGLITYFLAWKKLTQKAKEAIGKAIVQNERLLPFSKQWNDIVEIVGEDLAFDSLMKCSGNTVVFVNFEIEHLNLKFRAFARGKEIGTFLFLSEGDEIREKRNQRFDKFLARHDELKKAYIAYLAREDILAYLWNRLEISSLEDWWSEQELARLENRKVHANPLFLNQRLKELFPRFAAIEYQFAGMLMDTLLWQKSKVKRELKFPREKNGFRISLLNDLSN